MNGVRAFLLAAALGVSLAAHARAEILIGIAGPMTGPNAAYGEEIKRGGEKAIADINAKGGVMGQTLRAVIADDACDPAKATEVAKDLVARKVTLVVGHVCSGSSIPASTIYAAANILEISPSTTNPEFTERHLPTVFRVCGRDDAQGGVAADYLLLTKPGQTIAIVDDKQTYGLGLVQAFKAAIAAKGATPVAVDEIDAGQKDFGGLIAKLKAAGAELVYFGGYYADAGALVRQMRDQGLGATMVGGDGLNNPNFWTIAGSAGEGTLMTFTAEPKLDPVNADLVKFFSDQGFDPTGYTFYAYAAVQVWAETAERAVSFDTAKVAAGLRTFRFETAVGTLGFNGKGDRTGQVFAVYTWHDGQPVYAQRN